MSAMEPNPILPLGPKEWTESTGSYGKLSPKVEGGLCDPAFVFTCFDHFKLRVKLELSFSGMS